MVATELCVGVIGMYHSGIGGGGFMLVRDKNGRYEAIDYRESAPAAAHQDMYKDDPKASVTGGLSVAVPGELRGLEYLHKTYGVSGWSSPEVIPNATLMTMVTLGITVENSCAAVRQDCTGGIRR